MFQFFLYILQLIIIGILSIACLTCFALLIVTRHNLQRSLLALLLVTALAFALYNVWNFNPYGTETTKREEALEAFESNFGFGAPETVSEIKLKNFVLADSHTHWMCFTYDPVVFRKIVSHDQPLGVLQKGTKEYDEATKNLAEGCANCPSWLKAPGKTTPRIYYKRDFMNHGFSEYHLWADTLNNYAYLEVTNAD